MGAAIYFFSGTGNSFVVARDIAQKLSGRLIPISSVIDAESISTEDEVIGIVFPVYHAIFDGIPFIVKRFIAKLNNLESKYLFAVCTCKGWSRVTISKMREAIDTCGGELSTGFVVQMPDNSSRTTIEQQQKLFGSWRNKLPSIINYVKDRRKGRYERNKLFNMIMAPFATRLERETLRLFYELADASDLPFEELVHLSDRSYIADDKCTGCGTCARVCPANDIKLTNNRPEWQNRCENCLACINWCPKQAIHGGLISTGKVPILYHHPDIKASDMFARELLK